MLHLHWGIYTPCVMYTRKYTLCVSLSCEVLQCLMIAVREIDVISVEVVHVNISMSSHTHTHIHKHAVLIIDLFAFIQRPYRKLILIFPSPRISLLLFYSY